MPQGRDQLTRYACSGTDAFTFHPDADRAHEPVAILRPQMPGQTVVGVGHGLAQIEDVHHPPVRVDTAAGVSA